MNFSSIDNQAAAAGGGRLSPCNSKTNKKKLHLFSMSKEPDDPNTAPIKPTARTTALSFSCSSAIAAVSSPCWSSSPSSSFSSSGSCSCSSITQMNSDSLISILQLLPVESIVSFSMTCRKLRSLGSSDALWEAICKRDWGSAPATTRLSSSSLSLTSSLPSSSSSSLEDVKMKAMVSWKRVYQQIFHVASIFCSLFTSRDGYFPQPRASHSLNFVSGYLILFGGGCEGGRHLDDTWVAYAGEEARGSITWKPLKSNGPIGRFGHSCTLVGNTLVLFGGISDNGIRRNDTWFGKLVFDAPPSIGIDLSWEMANVGATAPPPRGAHACCRIGDDKVLIHGGIGLDGMRLDDMWLLDISGGLGSATWRPIAAAHPSRSPPARSGHSLTWIGGSTVVLFGGRGIRYEVLNDVWILAMDDHSPSWLEVVYSCPAAAGRSPLPRVGHSATSILGGRVLIYGGEDSLRHRKDDFWLLNISSLLSGGATTATVDSVRAHSKMWRRLKAEGEQPVCRSFHAACGEEHSGLKIFVFGGMVDGILHPAESYGLRFDGALYLLNLSIQ